MDIAAGIPQKGPENTLNLHQSSVRPTPMSFCDANRKNPHFQSQPKLQSHGDAERTRLSLYNLEERVLLFNLQLMHVLTLPFVSIKSGVPLEMGIHRLYSPFRG